MLTAMTHRPAGVVPQLTRLLLSLGLLLAATAVFGVEVPAPESLEREFGLARQTVEVVEPHASRPGQPVRIPYLGFPMNALLNRWFGERWKSADTEVVFFALDGYRSAIPAAKLSSLPAFLAFARGDGAPFALDNREQNEKIALGPYYLIWDNLKAPELQPQGSSAWPYQVTRVELRPARENDALRPPDADAETLAGLADTAAHCLTCHRLRGLGGEKYPEDLSTVLCRWTAADLQRWIDDPSRVRPGTPMPALNRSWPEVERQQVAGRIVHYLDAIKRSDSALCAAGKG